MTTENYFKMHLHVCGINNNWSSGKDSILTSQLYL